jgi:hypothetical protein
MRSFALWKSERAGWICLAVLLLLGLPLFVRMPLWCDVSLYDVAAWNVSSGGVHYRDVFDTNMPGVIWIHVLVRSLAGWSSEAMRLFDVAVLTAIVLLLVRWLRELEVTRAGRIWFAVGVVLFYLFQPESCHCQRDLWMLLPALAAVRLRLTRLVEPRSRLLQAALEGCLWGLAIWIKPHVLIPAFVVWLVSAVWIAGQGAGSLGRLAEDTLGLVVGGILVGDIGIAWMLASGTWPPFWEVFVHWNPHYWTLVKAELPFRYGATFLYFPPWSLLHLVALPLAVANLFASRFWSARPTAAVPQRKAILAALYLGWMGQALYLQHAYEYVHVPEMILALALVTAQRWAVGFAYLAWFAVAGLVCNLGSFWPPLANQLASLREQHPLLLDNLLPLHPLARADRIGLWPQCWTGGNAAALRDRLAYLGGTHPSTSWSELEEVAEYLRRQEVADGELICWHDSTHPLYLLLGVKPAIRFMHVGTVLLMEEHYDDVRQNLLDARHKKFVVSDLVRVLFSAEKAGETGPGGRLDLPPALSEKQRHVFPFDQPVVFRSSGGRYLVHRIEKPIDRIDILQPFTDD